MKLISPVQTGKRGFEGQLTNAQAAIVMQEESIRRNEREKKQMLEKLNGLEKSLAAAEQEKHQLQVRYCSILYLSIYMHRLLSKDLRVALLSTTRSARTKQ